jgi:uncharacterized protein involved in exopolysaccharide biosynthesis
VLLQVIRDTHLEKDPEFGGGDSSGISGSLLGLVGVELRPTAEQQKQIQMGALEALNRHINVKKTDRTFIVDIDVWSYEPGQGGDARQRDLEGLSRRIQAVAGRRRAARDHRPFRPA